MKISNIILWEGVEGKQLITDIPVQNVTSQVSGCVRMCNLSVHLFFVEFTFFNMLCCLNISPILLFISSRVQCLGEQPSDRPIPNATLQVTGAVGWRREGLVYKKNEVSCVLSYFHSLSLLPYYCRFTTLIHYRSSWILLRV